MLSLATASAKLQQVGGMSPLWFTWSTAHSTATQSTHLQIFNRQRGGRGGVGGRGGGAIGESLCVSE